MPTTVDITPNEPVIDAADVAGRKHVRFTFTDPDSGDAARITFTHAALRSFLTSLEALAGFGTE